MLTTAFLIAVATFALVIFGFKLKDDFAGLVELADARNDMLDEEEYIENRVKRKATWFATGPVERAQMGGGSLKRDVQVIVIGIAFIAVGVLLVAELDAALPAITNSSLSADYETTLDNFGTGLTLIGVAMIVIPAISILRRMDVL